MTEERQHALLSASAAHRWIACPPSARIGEHKEDKSTRYADEGTEAHILGEFKVKQALGLADASQSPVPSMKYFNSEMDDYTTDYAVFVLELMEKAYQISKDPILIQEQRLDYSKYAPEGFGTCDVVIVADKTLYVADFKYGAGVLVDAENNPQLMLYALAALDTYDGIYDIEEVCMAIYQPRREHTSFCNKTADELRQWAEEVVIPAATLAYAGEGEFNVGDHCQFCRAKAECRARAEHNMALTKEAFKLPPLLDDDEIPTILSQLDELVNWANSVKEYAFQEALKGKKWDGYKIVAGRAGNRKFTDDKAVAKAATAAGYTNIYRQSLITLTAMERMMGKAEFRKVLGDLITKPPGKPALVPNSDKRKPMELMTAVEAFAAEPIQDE